MLNAPPNGFPLYFAVGERTHYVNKMAVTLLDRSNPPVFTRQHPLEWEGIDGAVTFEMSTFVLCSDLAMVLFIL